MTPPMHAWHPLVVHLPLIGFFAALSFDLFDAWSAAPRFRIAATWLWWAALAGAAAAVGTGLWAYGQVDHSDPAHVVMTRHRNLAFATVALLAAAAWWRMRQPRSRWASVLAVAGVSGLVVTGDMGARLVFGHAIGIPSPRLAAILVERNGDMAPGHAMPTAGPAPAADTAPVTSDGHRHRHGTADSVTGGTHEH